MRVVIQRVSEASVKVDGLTVGAIGTGLLVLVGIEDADSTEDVQWLAAKIAGLRIFSDNEGLMNLSLADTGGGILCISQFTLHAATKKGNRPSFIRAAKPPHAVPLYEAFVKELESVLGKKVETGVFGADMKVALINDGPVTVIIDTKNKE
ncbi:D-tyrosyl-tRNA(Tyr) deacylase [Flaviaesturariibacter flavus]|uniref:D-aminoacyl-tRNA deacylase n=1 Tax=Flaviaesturariibacter flavus TaxID=2502780 RepID=A0A4R1BBC5_9BACT|nr:D-aminoacyl-tRNA deacylase [Flaviaesturariibacter flavus]TCJ14305.1 D-tyrosyl-tRNA(Tyr) deacylase [Flaviaesturariibacter flavus]